MLQADKNNQDLSEHEKAKPEQLNPQAIERKVVSGEVWDEFCDSLKSLGKYITSPETPDDPLNRAEGFRYLTRLLRGTLESVIEGSSPNFPVMRPIGYMVKMGADNPDILYMGAAVHGANEYRIRGNVGTVNYISIASISGGYGRDGTMTVDGTIDSSTLKAEPDGSFEIVLSQREHSGNWLELSPETRSINVRQTFLNRNTEKPAEMEIEVLGDKGTPPPYTAERLHRHLQNVSRNLHGTVKVFSDWTHSLKSNMNVLPHEENNRTLGGDPNFFYFHGHWSLEDDEVLEIRAPVIPECKSWNFQLDNYWMESLDYCYHSATFNKHTAAYEDDGSVVLFVAHSDPRLQNPELGGNWVDTASHNNGTLCWRWMEAKNHPPLETRLVKFSELVAV